MTQLLVCLVAISMLSFGSAIPMILSAHPGKSLAHSSGSYNTIVATSASHTLKALSSVTTTQTGSKSTGTGDVDGVNTGTFNQGAKYGNWTPSAKAVYFISNTAANSIIALSVNANGSLSDGSVTLTGGKGLSGVDAKGAPAVPDSLFSQGSVKVSGSHLVAVNPGSNTISMFQISHKSPSKLTMIGKPANSIGEFPVSVAISTALKMACVANSGAVAGIACYKMHPTQGLIPLDKNLRPFNLKQTTPPSGPLNTVSQVLFNKDSTMLLATVKGDPTKNNTGFISQYPISNGVVSHQEIRSSPAGTAVLFGSALLADTNELFVTDASFGTATLSLNPAIVKSASGHSSAKNMGMSKSVTKADKRGLFSTIKNAFSSLSKDKTPAAASSSKAKGKQPSVRSNKEILSAANEKGSVSVNKATVLTSTKIADQKATCWATFSKMTKTAFVTDVAVNHLVEIDPATGKVVKNLASTNGNAGMIDLEADKEGKRIYALSPSAKGTNVVVYDVSGGRGSAKEVQNFGVGMGVSGGSAMGMAIF